MKKKALLQAKISSFLSYFSSSMKEYERVPFGLLVSGNTSVEYFFVPSNRGGGK